jgi:hypothetical protein
MSHQNKETSQWVIEALASELPHVVNASRGVQRGSRNSNSGCTAWRVRFRRAVSEREMKFVRQRLQLQIDGCQYFRASPNRNFSPEATTAQINPSMCGNDLIAYRSMNPSATTAAAATVWKARDGTDQAS